jgi:hypothetical protein
MMVSLEGWWLLRMRAKSSSFQELSQVESQPVSEDEEDENEEGSSAPTFLLP